MPGESVVYSILEVGRNNNDVIYIKLLSFLHIMFNFETVFNRSPFKKQYLSEPNWFYCLIEPLEQKHCIFIPFITVTVPNSLLVLNWVRNNYISIYQQLLLGVCLDY